MTSILIQVIICIGSISLCKEIAMFVIQGKRLEIPKDTHPEIASLIKNCWAQEPEKRPGCADILRVLERVMNEVPEPLPLSIHNQIGWHGDIDREESERLLRGCIKGTFLVRYSRNQSSFVLSHKDDTKKPITRIFYHSDRDYHKRSMVSENDGQNMES
jgi:hypothetical protein